MYIARISTSWPESSMLIGCAAPAGRRLSPDRFGRSLPGPRGTPGYCLSISVREGAVASPRSRSFAWRPLNLRALFSSDPELIADPADLAVGEIDFQHILRRADRADRGVAADVEDFGSVVAVFDRRDVAVIAVDRKGQPVRSASTVQPQWFFQDRRNRIPHIPDEDARVARAAAVPDLAFVGGPADPVQQPEIAGRIAGQFRRDDLAGCQIGDLHAPQ